MKYFAEPIRTALQILNDSGHAAWLAGGAVRDFVMGKEPDDYDIATDALPAETRAAFEAAGYPVIDTGIAHGTVTVLLGSRKDGAPGSRKNGLALTLPVEITTFRTDGDYSDHRHPDGVTFTRSLEEDLARRDFTINAMAMDKTEKIVDLYGGREDIRQGVIKCVREPNRRLQEDALRILRALRFSATLGFSIDPALREAIFAEKEGLAAVSGERIRAELLKLLAGKNAEAVLNGYAEIFEFLFPVLGTCVGFEQHGAKHAFDVWGHTAHVVAGVSGNTPENAMRVSEKEAANDGTTGSERSGCCAETKDDEKTADSLRFPRADEAVLLAALFHDIGKPAVARMKEDGTHDFSGHGPAGAKLVVPALERLKPDRELYRNVIELIDRHDRKVPTEKPAIRQELREIGKEQWLRFLALKNADQHGLKEAYWGEPGLDALLRLTGEILADGDCWSVTQLAVSGDDLIRTGIAPGPAVGEALNGLLDRVIAEELPNEREALLAALQ